MAAVQPVPMQTTNVVPQQPTAPIQYTTMPPTVTTTPAPVAAPSQLPTPQAAPTATTTLTTSNVQWVLSPQAQVTAAAVTPQPPSLPPTVTNTATPNTVATTTPGTNISGINDISFSSSVPATPAPLQPQQPPPRPVVHVPSAGRFYDVDCDRPAHSKLSEHAPPKKALPTNNSQFPTDVIISQLKAANEEIARVYKVEKALKEENERLTQKLNALQRALADQVVTGKSDAVARHGYSSNLRPYLGVEVVEVHPKRSRDPPDVVVKNILPGFGADEAGVHVNDVLRKWNGLPIRSRSDFGILVTQATIGEIIKLQVERGVHSRQLVLRVEVKGTPASSAVDSPVRQQESTPQQFRSPGNHARGLRSQLSEELWSTGSFSD
eukprot:TRINITY_DN58134_c0_g1_i1.p1 TRINITY_DN58134_c0_g1~~TRINITY_DN58134_c0_g1_i1.p1  ORF type:complete len:380 (-),score=75.21 TRINITY_DN58134_c0_g1_i1:1431-2570(-)